MVKEFIFFVGLPGCGKSTYITENFKGVCYYGDYTLNVNDKLFDTVVVSADRIKKGLRLYDPKHPEYVHQHSVELAQDAIYNMIGKWEGNIILDGGGINNHYNQDIIEKFRKLSPETKITCIHFDVPVDVCIKRIEQRERKVPVSEIYKKNLMLVSCLKRYQNLVDEYVRVPYYTNKKLFLDMDGTIAAYGKNKYDEYGNKDFCCSELFLHLKPVQHIIDYVKEHWNCEDVYICSAVANSVVWDEKNTWLDNHFPEIPKANRLFVGNKHYKHVFIKNFCAKMKWDLKDVTLVDDLHEILHKCEEYGINAVHPSNITSLHDKYSTIA